MGSDDRQKCLQVDDFDSVSKAFISWAGGRNAVRVLYTPDPLLAVDTKDRRGLLLDEIYFAKLWADRGHSELELALTQAMNATGRDLPVPSSVAPNPHELIDGVMEHGHRVGLKSR
ncbi:MAG: hypothetical protein AAGA65_09445 [Actinomycetota bacterium]